jgi:hypothetical protein
LVKTDFEAATDAARVATLSVAAGGQWSQGTLNAAGLPRVNATGKTQFRVYFNLDDNDDRGNDYVIFNTGAASTASLRPQLIVSYEAAPTPVAAPTSLIAKPVSVTQIGLSWVDSAANETGFKIERLLDGGRWIEIARTGPNATSYTESGLTEGVAYTYRVRSYNELGDSVGSNSASAAPSNPPVVVTFTSIGTEDGYVLESAEGSNVGGSFKAGSPYVGDSSKDFQYQSVFSFDTSALPDGAVIVAARLRLRMSGLSGTVPFTTHGPCWVDIKGGTGFGGSPALAKTDFEAAADVTKVAAMTAVTATGQWSEGQLTSTGAVAVNRAGRTQFRVYFALDDNDDAGNDYVKFYPGSASTGSKPELVIEYLNP